MSFLLEGHLLWKANETPGLAGQANQRPETVHSKETGSWACGT